MALSMSDQVLAAFVREHEASLPKRIAQRWNSFAPPLEPISAEAVRVRLEASAPAAESYGLEADDEERRFLLIVAMYLIPQPNAAQALMLGDILFEDTPEAVRVERIRELSRDPQFANRG